MSQTGDRHGWQKAFLAVLRHELLERGARHDHVGMLLGNAEDVEHQHRIGDRGIDGADAVLTVQPLADEGHGLVDGSLARTRREQRLNDVQKLIEPDEEGAPEADLIGGLRPALHREGRDVEQFVDADGARIRGLGLQRHHDKQRDDGVARPVAEAPDVDREPARRVHELDRHHRHGAPRHDAVEGQHHAGEDVDVDGTPVRQDGLARSLHMRSVDVVAGDLQREIGLHARRDVELAPRQHRPAAMRFLQAAQIIGGAALHFGVGLAEEVLHQDVFRGDRGVGLKVEGEVPVRPLLVQQRRLGPNDGGIEV